MKGQSLKLLLALILRGVVPTVRFQRAVDFYRQAVALDPGIAQFHLSSDDAFQKSCYWQC